jgi:glycosyltransferase involved in cell wall biosynthesis
MTMIYKKKLRGLWLARELPFLPDRGDRVYSAGLARSLAEAGADLTLAGLAPDGKPEVPAGWPIHWHPVSGPRNGALSAWLSAMPWEAAVHATDRYRHEVSVLALDGWDFVVFDHCAMGWALEPFRELKQGGHGPVLVHVAHRHEASVSWRLCREFRGSSLKHLGLWQDGLKLRAFERSLLARMDLIAAISDGDAALFEADAPRVPTVVLKPGYGGTVAGRTAITSATPRRVALVGSCHGMAQQENLRRFLAVADPAFAQRGIELHLAGAMPPEFAAELKDTCRAVRWHGFVDDLAAFFEAARIAVVPDGLGGGFKLRFLDAVFGRVPVATLDDAAAGLPDDLREAMFCRDQLEPLVAGVCGLMDDLETLNRMQEAALAAAEGRFRWEDRGRTLLSAILAARSYARPVRGAAAACEALPRP